MRLRVILVEPQEAGNVGAAARAMKNFGFTDLYIVGDREKHALDEKSVWWAMGADDVLQNITRVSSLEEALADCNLTCATTAIRGRQVFEQLSPASLGAIAREELAPEHRLGLVFGREKWGLTGHEISLCQRTCSIPTWPQFPTMNLAQSVAVLCYELRQARELKPKKPRDLPPRDLTLALEKHARELMAEINFFESKNPDKVCGELQAVAGRAMLTTREASLILAFIRLVQTRLDRTS
jgi:tRNA (cytidine32/uridine32-2'-O)-methyltransferase